MSLPAPVRHVLEGDRRRQHVHRRHELLRAVGLRLVHEALGVVRVERDVVVDPVPLHVVLVAGRGVADRVEAGRLGDRRVGPLRQIGERARRRGPRRTPAARASRPPMPDRSTGAVGSNAAGSRAGAVRRGRTGRCAAPSPAVWPAPWPSRAANGPHSWAAIQTWTIGLRPPALSVPGAHVAVVVGEPGDDRLAVLVELPAQVLVDVPLHQRPAVVDELRVVERHVLGDEHRRDERPAARRRPGTRATRAGSGRGTSRRR